MCCLPTRFPFPIKMTEVVLQAKSPSVVHNNQKSLRDIWPIIHKISVLKKSLKQMIIITINCMQRKSYLIIAKLNPCEFVEQIKLIKLARERPFIVWIKKLPTVGHLCLQDHQKTRFYLTISNPSESSHGGSLWNQIAVWVKDLIRTLSS
jgi:hypothetical protein